MARGLKLYTSYSFKTKDPVIDNLRTIVQDEGLKFGQVADLSGVSGSTISNWFTGPTLRPQFATIMAVTRSLGYDLLMVDPKTGKTTMINPRNKR